MIGLIGGIGGAVIGIMGGVIGTYFSIRNTAGPRERDFVVRASALTWVVVAAFLVVLGCTPMPYRALVWVPYLLLLAPAIRAFNRRQEEIRRQEASGAVADGSEM
jgi:hypothetical protein